MKLGMPVRVYSVPPPPLETSKGRWECLDDASNDRAAELLFRLPAQELTNSHTQVLDMHPKIDGDVLIVREDGEDLSVNHLAAMWRIVRDCMAAANNGLGPVADLTSYDYHRALEKQESYPEVVSNLTATGLKPTAFPEGFMELIDPRLLSDGPAPALNTVAAPALPSRDKTARPVLQDERTLPSLWTQVKARGGRLGTQPRIEFEGYSFKLFARNDQEQEPEDNAEGPPDEADIDV
jgi:hypothetical protein